MEDSNPFSIGLNLVKDAAASTYDWVRDRLSDVANFFGLEPANPTSPLSLPYTPPFSGGQCSILYSVLTKREAPFLVGGQPFFIEHNIPSQLGAIGGLNKIGETWYLQTGAGNLALYTEGAQIKADTVPIILSVTAETGVDNCGDLPNPNPSLSPEYGGGTSAQSDSAEDLEETHAVAPVVTVGGLLAALKTVADVIRNISDALDGIRKIGDAIKAISDLLDELFNDKKDRDKKKPENRRRLVGFWRECDDIDGFINLGNVMIGSKPAIPYRLQFVVESFPPTSSRILGVKSPSICIDALPLFYLSWQDDSTGIQSIREVRTLNSSNAIPPFVIGAFYNFRLNPEFRAKFRIFYEMEPEEEEKEVEE